MTKNTRSTYQKGPDQLLRSSSSQAAAGSTADIHTDTHSYTPRRLGEASSFFCVSPTAKVHSEIEFISVQPAKCETFWKHLTAEEEMIQKADKYV